MARILGTEKTSLLRFEAFFTRKACVCINGNVNINVDVVFVMTETYAEYECEQTFNRKRELVVTKWCSRTRFTEPLHCTLYYHCRQLIGIRLIYRHSLFTDIIQRHLKRFHKTGSV